MSETTRPKRKKSDKELAGNREYQKRYYAENKEELLAAKKNRYQNDENYRRQVRLRSKRRHWLGTRQEGEREVPAFGVLADILPKGEIVVKVDNPKDVRHGTEVTVPVFSTGAVSQLLAKAPEVLRLWWKRKQIPEPFHRGGMVPNNMVKGRNPRLFTLDEMRALDAAKEKLTLASKGAVYELFAKDVQAAFDLMHQGLVLEVG